MASDIGQNETETDSIIILGERKADDEISIDSFKKPKSIPPPRQASSVWNYFEKIFDDNSALISIKCIHCGQKYSSKSSTTTLNDHLKRRHSNVQPEKDKSQQTHQMSSQEYSDILNNFINWVVMDCQPFRVVDNPSFRGLIFSLNSEFKVPSRQTLRKKIDDKYEEYKKKIIKIFQVKFYFINFNSY
jgi:BED zinc finger